LARWYFRRHASREASERADRRNMFGKFREGFRSLRPQIRKTDAGPIVEIPVTTCPLVKLPIHMTYLLYLWQVSPRLTKSYLHMALTACRVLGIGPSILLHPLDFLGREDDEELKFFPGMNISRDEKLDLINNMLAQLTAHFQIGTMRRHAEFVRSKCGIPVQRRTAPARPVAEPLVAAIGK
jgi:hypothetical protein